jgi:DNA adenine methylase
MEKLRLFKYPGTKNSLLQPLLDLFRSSGCITFVDLFGGSGYVSLNVPSERIIYNDVNPEICRVFETIKEDPAAVRRHFGEALRAGLFKRESLERADANFRRWASTRDVAPDISEALLTILKHTISFGGEGNTYATREKAVIPYARKTFEMLPAIAEKVSRWIIENSDFEPIIRKYDSDSVLFYLDPPYGSKKWYHNTFSSDDYFRMRNALHSIRGKYVMNFDYNDRKLLEIFGEPDFVYEVQDLNQNPDTGMRPTRRYYFSTNFLH